MGPSTDPVLELCLHRSRAKTNGIGFDLTGACVHVFVSGKVQGVWFRASTKRLAERRGLSGWAKNLDDGRVEVLLCGAHDAVEEVVAWLHKGPVRARVEAVEVKRVPFCKCTGFRVE